MNTGQIYRISSWAHMHKIVQIRSLFLAFVVAANASANVASVSAANWGSMYGDQDQKDSSVLFDREALDFFESKVRPILLAHCVECHGPELQEGDLRLDSREKVLQGGQSGRPAAVDGRPYQSLLIEAVIHSGDLKMPPGEQLSEVNVQALQRWIELGLPWSPESSTLASSTMEERIKSSRERHWSLQPIEPPRVSLHPADSWSYSSIDRILFTKLETAKLSPSPDASRRVLLRRLKYDLLGLPVSEAEVAQFEKDPRPDAYERWVDRYLANPAFGERWGRHWLDVARYGDTRGYAFARDRRYPFAFTYRDYVIRAMNEDKPFDQFVTEQLAADQLGLPNFDPSLAALGFLTTGRRYNNPHDDIDDQIDVVSRGLLGLTLACARCHDHKYDAIPTEDYYSLYGVFASCKEPSELPLIGLPAEVAEYQTYLKRLNRHRNALREFRSHHQQRLMDHARQNVSSYLIALVSERRAELDGGVDTEQTLSEEVVPAFLKRWRAFLRKEAKPDHPVFGIWARLLTIEDLESFSVQVAMIERDLRENRFERVNQLVSDAFLHSPPQSMEALAKLYGSVFEATHDRWVSLGANEGALAKMSVDEQQIGLALYDTRSPTRLTDEQVHGHLSKELRRELRSLQEEIDEVKSEAPSEVPRAMVVHDRREPVQPYVFVRGQPGRRGKQVDRRFVGLLSEVDSRPFTNGSGRLELAKRITSADNPLTARVIVNRIWMHHFGEPLVESPSDFGVRSDRPMQLEVLDFLAFLLMEQEWSQKAVHRAIVTSRVYQQSSKFRQDCASVDPDNRLLWRMNRRVLEFEPLRDSLLEVAGELDREMYGPSESLVGDIFSHRRAVYGIIDRQDLPNLFRVFDFASPDQSTARRSETIVPQQALFLMNSPFVLSRAKSLSRRVPFDARHAEESIHRLFGVVLARSPAADELDMALSFLREGEGLESSTSLTRWEQFCHMVLLTNEFSYVD